MSQSLPKIAVLGCGYWGRNLVRNFAEIGGLAAISDPSQSAAQELSERFGAPVRSFEEVLSAPDIDGVAIAAPAPLHADLATQCLNAGKHVMIEKPIALSLDDAHRIVDLGKRVNKLVMVGHLLNYHDGFLKVVELVQSGTLGNLRRIHSNRLSLGKVRLEENVLWSFAPHDISMILRLAGGIAPESVVAHGSSHVSADIEDFCHVHLSFGSELAAHIYVSWLQPVKEQKLVVVGDEGMIVFDDTLPPDQKVALYRHKVAIVGGVPEIDRGACEYQVVPASEPLKAECLAFMDGMASPESIYTDGDEGIRVLDVLSRAQADLDAAVVHKASIQAAE